MSSGSRAMPCPRSSLTNFKLVPATALLRSRLRIGAFPRSSTFLGRPRNLWVTSTGIAAEICIRIGATARSLGCEHKTLEAHHRTVNRPFGVTWQERSERRRHPQMNRRQPPKKPQNAIKKTDYEKEHRAGELPQSLKARLPAVW